MKPLLHVKARNLARRGVLLGCLDLTLVLVLATPLTAAAQPSPALRPGDIVSAIGRPSPVGAFVFLDPPYRLLAGGATLSDFGDPNQGPTASGFAGLSRGTDLFLAIEDATAVFAVIPLSGVPPNARYALFRVDAATGSRAIISDFGDASQGPLGAAGLAIEHSGDFLVVGLDRTALVRVSRSTGARVVVSDFSDPAQGPVFEGGPGVAVEESGHIVVGGSGGIFRVDPSSGVRTVLSDFANPAQGPVSPRDSVRDLAVDKSGNIMAVNTSGSLFSVDPASGIRRLVTYVQSCLSFPSNETYELAIDEAGDIRVFIFSYFGFEFIGPLPRRVDPVTGECRGGDGGGTFGVAVVPTPLVNELVSLSVLSTAFEPSVDPQPAPAGVFRITATFTNVTSTSIRNPFFRVAEISGGNLLVNGDRPPTVAALSGRGARLTPDVGSDGVLTPGESLEVVFDIGLQTREPFTFFVNVFGEAL